MNEFRMHRRSLLAAAGGLLAGTATGHLTAPAPARGAIGQELPAGGLVGHWPLRGDCQDHSGAGNHGRAHGSGVAEGVFDGRTCFVEVSPSESLRFGRGDFTLSAWVWTASEVDDVIGDVVDQYDPVRRCGFHLTVKSTSGGYSSHGDDRHVYFGIDDGKDAVWEDCGRPSPTSNYVSNSLTVFDGHLHAANTDAAREEDWCHVFRYRGGQAWEDCGRVGDRRTHGVGPMVVHRGHLYAATWSYDWTRVGLKEPLDDFCRVYRYAGGTTWDDCGQPGRCRRLFGLASFRGRLYVTAEDARCYVHDGGRTWRECGRFPNYAHPLGVHDGKLYAGVLNPAGVWAFDGERWTSLGNPQGREERCDQVHALEVFRGRLHVTTWPEGHVVRLEPDGRWADCGRLGDALEINALNVYNGQLYAGTIPRAEVFRFRPEVGAAVEARLRREPPPPPRPVRPGGTSRPGTGEGGEAWTSIRRFLDPAGHVFRNPEEWSRVTSLTEYQGKLFASLGSCTSSRLDAPCDFRGRVYAMQVGQGVSYDRDLGAGWKHLTAVKRGGRLELFVDGVKACESPPFEAGRFDLRPDRPLRIGFGETDYFSGKIRDVRAYRRALDPSEVGQPVRADRPR